MILREGVRFSLLLPEEVLVDQGPKLLNGKEVEDGPTSTDVAAIASNTQDGEDGKAEPEEDQYEEDDFEAEALDGFQKIYADVQEQYGESFFVLTQNGPLFSTNNGRSTLDPRDFKIPAIFNTTRSLPYSGAAASYQLSYISPKVSMVPHPAIPPTEFMTGFVHPSGVSLPLPKFLNNSPYQRFAPTVDQSNAVVNETVVNTMWYEKYSKKVAESNKAIQHIIDSKTSEAKELENGNAQNQENGKKAEDTNNTKENGDIEMPDVEPVNDSSLTNDVEKVTSETSEEDLDFLSTLTWAPDHFIDEDEIEAAKTNTEQALLSRLILELQNMQRARLAKTDASAFVLKPEERRLAIKIQNMLARLVGETTPAKLQIQPSPKYPVLQAAYPGVLQVSEVKQPGPAAGGMRPSRYTPKKYRKQ